MEDLQIVEHVVRKDPKVIEQCGLIGIPPEDMHKVYCDRTFIPTPSLSHTLLQSQLTSLQPGQSATTSASVPQCVYNRR